MNAPSSVLVVGASAAGLATVEALRRKGYRGGLTVLGAEPHLPYDRPPLSKQVLSGIWNPERARLRLPAALSTLDAEFILADPAVGLDTAARTVHTTSGRALRADAVVVATGLRPRTLPGQADLAGVHVPYFWTDQFDAKIQVHGVLPVGAEVTIVDGDLESRRFVALYRHDGRVTGVLGWNMPKQTRLRRQEVVDAIPDLAPALR
jgi:NADPH-dependent 2,4-dienoyl-CoA reductase/sulfur reductase-like enzyme